MNMHMLSLNFNKTGPCSRRVFRNELNLLEQIFCEYLSRLLIKLFSLSQPTTTDSPYWRFTCSNLDKALSRASFSQRHRAKPGQAND